MTPMTYTSRMVRAAKTGFLKGSIYIAYNYSASSIAHPAGAGLTGISGETVWRHLWVTQCGMQSCGLYGRKWQLSKQVAECQTWPSAEGRVISSSISREASGTYDNPNQTFLYSWGQCKNFLLRLANNFYTDPKCPKCQKTQNRQHPQ